MSANTHYDPPPTPQTSDDGLDEYGTDPETGQCGTGPGDWWHENGESSWTDNRGVVHTDIVTDDNW